MTILTDANAVYVDGATVDKAGVRGLWGSVDALATDTGLLGTPGEGFDNQFIGAFITKGTGQVSSASDSWSYTSFIPTRKGQVFDYNGRINRDGGAAIAYYDSEQKYLSDGLVADPAGTAPLQTVVGRITIPEGVSYIRASGLNTQTLSVRYVPTIQNPEIFAKNVISVIEKSAGVEKIRLQAALNELLNGSALPSSLANLTGIGDSFTVGANATAPANRFLNIVAAKLGASVTNYGQGGTILQNGNGSGGTPLNGNGRDKFRALFTRSDKKEFALIAYGFNDARYTAAPATINAANYKNDYREIIVALLCDGYRRDQILIVGPHYITDVGLATGSTGFTGQTQEGFAGYVTAAREVAEEFGVLYFDSYAHSLEYLETNSTHIDTATFTGQGGWEMAADAITYVDVAGVENKATGSTDISVTNMDKIYRISCDVTRTTGTFGQAKLRLRWLDALGVQISVADSAFVDLTDTATKKLFIDDIPDTGTVLMDAVVVIVGSVTDGQVRFSNIKLSEVDIIDTDYIHPTNLGHEVIADGIINKTTVLNQKDAPIISEISGASGSLTLKWGSLSKAISYEVAQARYDTLVISTAVPSQTNSSHQFTGLATGQYIGMVRAIYSDGPGPWSVSGPKKI